MKNCYIIGSGMGREINTTDVENAFVIAADGGYYKLREKGIIPSLILGDFDSSDKPADFENILIYPREKDKTDTQLAVEKGIEAGCENFFIYGGTGGREDHTFANIQLLSYLAERNLKGFLIYENMAATVIKNSKLRFSANESGYISVFSFGNKAEKVSISGLKYEVKDISLCNSYPLGVSNEFAGKPSIIEVKDGSLFIMWQTKNVTID